MKKPIDIIVAGHLCLDLLPQMEHVRLSDLPSPGHLFETGPMRFSTGGAVSNTGLALHRLGMNVCLMSNVGDDLIGKMIVTFLQERDARLGETIQVRSGIASSYTVVLSPEKVDRIFLHCTGTNAVFSSTDIDYELVANSKIFHLGYPPLLPSLTANDGNEITRLFQSAKAAGTITSLDTSLPDPDGASGRVDWRKLLERTLPYVDVFVPSLEEILFMLHLKDYQRWRHDFLSVEYLNRLANELLEMGPCVVGFKLGELGIYLCGGTKDSVGRLDTLPVKLTEWSEKRIWHPAFIVDVVGTTGAGDLAYAGLLSAMVKGLDIQDAARWACAVGACNVEAADATSSIQSWADTQRRIDQGWQTHPQRLAGN